MATQQKKSSGKRSGPRPIKRSASARRGASATGSNVVRIDRLYDARPDRLDLRDLPYTPPLRSLPPVYPLETDVGRFIASYVKQGLILDQGDQGACTGFGLACVANYLLWTRHIEDKVKVPFLPVSPRMFYELAKRYDEWPGVDYDGSSCRGALKGWHKHGVCSSDAWPYSLDKKGHSLFVRPKSGWELNAARRPLGVYYRVDRASVVDLQSAIVNIGAVYVSANAHDGWDSLMRARAASAPKHHSELPSIAPMKSADSLGGHSFALVGFNDRGFVVQNSWGTRWGASGFAVLPYEDWSQNATDSWACGLGVPLSGFATGKSGATKPLASTRWRVANGQSLTSLDRSAREPSNPADDPWPIDHHFNLKAYEPWSTAAAYEHTLVTGNNGELDATDFTRDAPDKAGLADEIVHANPLKWFTTAGGKVAKLAVYVHGGLNSQDDSIKRIRVMGPCFEANGIYPLFLTWKSGAGETIADMAQDWLHKVAGGTGITGGVLDGLKDAKDRAVEALGHVLGKGIWTEMRENAKGGAEPGHGLDLLIDGLIALAADLKRAGKSLELHLIGHSAGGIMLGHFVAAVAARKPAAPPLAVASTTLYAAACSSAFANATYGVAAAAGVMNLASLWLYVLSDANEKADGLPNGANRAYGKSLLYLVSRALEDVRKQPLLGMERSLLPAFANDSDQWDATQLPEVQKWQKSWPGTSDASLLKTVNTPQVITTRQSDHIQASHGSFDNNIPVITETIERIKGAKLVGPLEWLDY